jgi:hypothetical protein
MKHSVLKITGILFIFLAGIGFGAGGVTLASQNQDEIRTIVLAQPTGNSPQAKVAAFVDPVIRGDKTAAIKLWEVNGKSNPERQRAIEKRRESVISDLVATKIKPDFMIREIEWWTTCCEPNVTNNSRNAGGARIKVQFLNQYGSPITYIFDIFTREQPYWGAAEGYRPRDWVIRDVYPEDKKPIFWPLIFESQIQFIQTAEP